MLKCTDHGYFRNGITQVSQLPAISKQHFFHFFDVISQMFNGPFHLILSFMKLMTIQLAILRSKLSTPFRWKYSLLYSILNKHYYALMEKKKKVHLKMIYLFIRFHTQTLISCTRTCSSSEMQHNRCSESKHKPCNGKSGSLLCWLTLKSLEQVLMSKRMKYFNDYETCKTTWKNDKYLQDVTSETSGGKMHG